MILDLFVVDVVVVFACVIFFVEKMDFKLIQCGNSGNQIFFSSPGFVVVVVVVVVAVFSGFSQLTSLTYVAIEISA